MSFQITKINTSKNLLAFSGGVDSSALFFKLLENKTPFDIAIVDYNVREESKEELAYAKELAKKYNKKIFIKSVNLENKSNFEKKARDIRYKFFEELIKENSYETLITAHQLNDKFEWLLMQLSKGAGLAEILSFEEIVKKKNYMIVKPLVNTTREEIINYLEKNQIKYFIDKSNSDEKFKRNYFRNKFSNRFLEEFEIGVKRSIKYLENDLNSLNINQGALLEEKELEVFKTLNDDNLNIRIIDKSLKKRGLLLSKLQREEILKQKEIVVSHKIAVCITEEFIFIAPYKTSIMPKKFKEKCRVKKIPKKIRAYLFEEELEKTLDSLVF